MRRTICEGDGRSFRPASQWWRNVLSTRDIFKGGVSYELGDGRAIKFWSDRWCGETSLQSRVADIFDEVMVKTLKVCVGFEQSGWSWGIIWKGLDLRGRVGRRRVAQLKEALEGFRIGHGPDVVLWRWSTNGGFTVRSTYRVLTMGDSETIAR